MIQRQVTFVEAVTMALTKNYCNFTGRASRSEFWWFQLFGAILTTVISAIFGMGSTGTIIVWVLNLALILPSLGLCVRRLHDINRTGWWIFIGLIPLVGLIILIVWYVKPSQESTNEYGEIPNLVNA